MDINPKEQTLEEVPGNESENMKKLEQNKKNNL